MEDVPKKLNGLFKRGNKWYWRKRVPLELVDAYMSSAHYEMAWNDSKKSISNLTEWLTRKFAAYGLLS